MSQSTIEAEIKQKSRYDYQYPIPISLLSINQSIKFIISVAHCRLDFTKKTVEKIQAQC